jgi:hypothetical protein
MKLVTILILILTLAVAAMAQYPLVPIDSIQWVPCWGDSSRFAGDTVVTGGLVTAGTGLYFAGSGVTFYMEDPGGGPFSGILAYGANAQEYPDLFPGDSILCTAQVSEYGWPDGGPYEVNMTELRILPGTFEFRRYGMPEPDPLEAFALEIDSTGGADSCAEKYEGVFIKVNNLVVDTVINYNTTSVWVCHDSTGTCFVREASDSIPNSYRPDPGTAYDFIQGDVYHRFGAYHLQPRYFRDMRPAGGAPLVTVTHRPLFPLVGDTVTFYANVVDDSGVPEDSVKLFYRINLSGWINVPMDFQGGDLYTFRLPSVVRGWEVDYYIRAVDDSNNVTFEPYEAPFDFYEYVVQQAQEMTIAQARVDLNADFIPDLLDSAVIVRGIAITPNFATDRTDFFMQQDNAGINVFFDSALVMVTPGDSILANGIVSQFTGKTQIRIYRGDRIVNYGPSGHVPAPAIITCVDLDDFNGEAYEGTLVRVNDVLILEQPNPWPALGQSATMTIVSGADSARLYIDRYTDIDGQPQTEPRATITGVVSQYDTFDPFLGYYELMPRYYSDFTWIVGVEDDGPQPSNYALHQNYPNPFNPSTSISFSLEKQERVKISVYNLLGQKVIELVNQEIEAGLHKVEWNGKDAAGKNVSSGIYFYKMQADDFESTMKMTLLK